MLRILRQKIILYYLDGPISNLNWPYKRGRDIHRRREDIVTPGTDCSHMLSIRGWQNAPGSWKKARSAFSPRASGESTVHPTPWCQPRDIDFRLLVTRSVKECCSKSPSVWWLVIEVIEATGNRYTNPALPLTPQSGEQKKDEVPLLEQKHTVQPSVSSPESFFAESPDDGMGVGMHPTGLLAIEFQSLPNHALGPPQHFTWHWTCSHPPDPELCSCTTSGLLRGSVRR